MAKFCQNCGKELEDNATFCGNCGATQNDTANNSMNYNMNNNMNNNMNSNMNYNMNNNMNSNMNYNSAAAHNVVPYRNIVTAIILSIITCGIYSIIWEISLQDDSNLISDDTTSGVVVFLLTLITCGIYGWFWIYKMGKKLYEAGQKYGVAGVSDNSLIYIVLQLFGLGIVNYCLIQSDLNKFSNGQ